MIIQKIEPLGSFTLKDGTVLFKNKVVGDTITCVAFSKTQTPPYAVGANVTADLNGKTDKDTGLPMASVKKADQGYSGGGGGKQGKSSYDAIGQQIGNCISNATNIMIARGSTEPEQMKVGLPLYAKILFDVGTDLRKKVEGGAE
jgi:hypothetical protein